MAKQIVIISGKGGTGKTIISGALCAALNNKIIIDADVDAADLFLLLNPDILETNKFSGGFKAAIDAQKCIRCGMCRDICRFDAVTPNIAIDEILCEGCGLCARLCPAQAIGMQPADSGEWYISKTKYGMFVHAKLGIAEENSGKLVSVIKNQANELAIKNNCEWIIIDGPPGIGCPAIAALSNSQRAVIATEPTMSGMHDAARVIELAKNFNVQIKLMVNKYDLNIDLTSQIEDYAKNNNIEFLGKIGFDKAVIESVVNKEVVLDNDNFKYRNDLIEILNKIVN